MSFSDIMFVILSVIILLCIASCLTFMMFVIMEMLEHGTLDDAEYIDDTNDNKEDESV